MLGLAVIVYHLATKRQARSTRNQERTMSHVLDSLFHLSDNGTTVRTEMLAGATTFLALAYIIFVQPAVLSACGMDFGAVMVATCVSSAIATLLMAWFENYPIAIAPTMGHNFFFAFSVVLAMDVPW